MAVRFDRKPTAPENLSEVLGRLFTAKGWGRKSERVALEHAWAEAVGAMHAEKTRVMAIRRGVVEVEVRCGMLLQELAQFQKRGLLTKLRAGLPGVMVSDLRLKLGVW